MVRQDAGDIYGSRDTEAEAKQQAIHKEAGIAGLRIEAGRRRGFTSVVTPVLRPLNVRLVGHYDAAAGKLALRFHMQLLKERRPGITLSHAHLQLMRATSAVIAKESSRLQRLLMPPGTQILVDLDSAEAVERTHREFVELLTREKYAEHGQATDATELSPGDRWRLQVLQDVVPEELQSRWMVPLMEQAEKSGEDKEVSLFASLSDSVQDINGLEIPTRYSLEVQISRFDVDLTDNTGRSALYIKAMPTYVSLEMQGLDDHRGVPIAAWCFSFQSRGMGLFYHEKEAFRFLADEDQASSDGYTALVLEIRNRFEEGRGVVSISGHCKPVLLSLTEDLIPNVRGFFRATGGENGDVDDGLDVRAQEMLAQYFASGQAWLQSAQGQDLMAHAKVRIPDAWEYDLHFKGPRVEWPVLEHCHVSLSAGDFRFKTLRMCTPDNKWLHFAFSQMQLDVKDRNACQHNMVGRASFDLAFQLDANLFDCSLSVDTLAWEASPEILKILLAAPSAARKCINFQPRENDGSLPVNDRVTNQNSLEVDAMVSARSTDEEVHAFFAATLSDQPLSATSSFVSCVDSMRDALSQQRSTHTPKDMGTYIQLQAQNYLEEAAKRLQPAGVVQGRDSRYSLDVKHLAIVCLDVVAPVLRLEASLEGLEVACYRSSALAVPLEAEASLAASAAAAVAAGSGAIDSGAASAVGASGRATRPQALRCSLDVFNVRVGRFEPLIELLDLSCQIQRGVDGSRSIQVRGNQPALINISPTAVRTLAWYVPHMLGEMSAELDHVRFRLLNLTARAVDLKFLSNDSAGSVGHASGSRAQRCEPSGSVWHSLDEQVLPARCSRVEFNSAVQLSLNQLGSARLPGPVQRRGELQVVQLLRPRLEYTLLLVSSPCLLFNDTSMPLCFRFPSGHQVLRTACASTALLTPNTEARTSQLANGKAKSLQGNEWTAEDLASGMSYEPVVPGQFMSAPPAACQVAADGDLRVRWSVAPAVPPGLARLASSGTIPSPVRVVTRQQSEDGEVRSRKGTTGEWAGPFEGRVGTSSVRCGRLRLLVACESHISAPPAAHPLLHMHFHPALRLVSGLPCDLDVEYKFADPEATSSSFLKLQRVTLCAFGDHEAYDIGTPGELLLRTRVVSGSWSPWLNAWVGDTGRSSEQEFILSSPQQANAPLTCQTRGICEIALFSTCLLINRTGWEAYLTCGGLPLQTADGVALHASSGSRGEKYALVAEGRAGPSFSLPVGAEEWSLAELADGRQVVLRSHRLPETESHGCHIRRIEILPRLVLHNASTRCVLVSDGRKNIEVPAGSVVPTLILGPLRFRPLYAASWSFPVDVAEHATGPQPIFLGTEVWTAEVRPDRGVLCFMMEEGSSYSVHNMLSYACKLRLRGVLPITIQPGEERQFGWLDPCVADADRSVQISINRRTSITLDPRAGQVRLLGNTAVVVSELLGVRTRLEVQPATRIKDQQQSLRLELMLPKLGISLVGQRRHPAELLYFEADQLHTSLVQIPEDDTGRFHFSLGDLQLDWQAGGLQAHHVVLGNRGESAQNGILGFCRVSAERGRMSSPEWHWRNIRLEVDSMEVKIEDHMLSPLLAFFEDLAPSAGSGSAGAAGHLAAATLQRTNAALREVHRCAGQGLVEDAWEPPRPAWALQVDSLHISRVALVFWCSVRLRTLTFLPGWVRSVVSTISFSETLEINGAAIRLKPKNINNVSGSTVSFAEALARAYMTDLLRSLARVLGNSSLLSLPLRPLSLSGVVERLAGDEYSAAPRRSNHDNAAHQSDEDSSSNGDARGDARGAGVPKLRSRRRPRLLAGPSGAIVEYSEFDAMMGRYLKRKIEVVIPLARIQLQADEDGDDASSQLRRQKSRESRNSTSSHASIGSTCMTGFGSSWGASEKPKERVLTLVLEPWAVSVVEVERPSPARFDATGEARLVSKLPSVELHDGAGGSRRSRTVHWRSELPLRLVEWRRPSAAGTPWLHLESFSREGSSTLPAPFAFGATFVDALTSALKSQDTALRGDWTSAVRSRLSQVRHEALSEEASRAEQMCSVWEVQRAVLAVGASTFWCSPFWPTDRERRHRWMVAGLQRKHPLLDPRIDWQRATEPPVAMLAIWAPLERWTVVTQDDTDDNGWRYGCKFSTTCWRSRPRPIIHHVRCREWRRAYRLEMAGDEKLVDSEWLHWLHAPKPRLAAASGRSRCAACVAPCTGAALRVAQRRLPYILATGGALVIWFGHGPIDSKRDWVLVVMSMVVVASCAWRGAALVSLALKRLALRRATPHAERAHHGAPAAQVEMQTAVSPRWSHNMRSDEI